MYYITNTLETKGNIMAKNSANSFNLNQFKPISSKKGPFKEAHGPGAHNIPGRLFNFKDVFQKAGIGMHSSISLVASALARYTATKVDEQGIHYPCTCNGPHHALIVANFSYLVASEMLEHPDMHEKIDVSIKRLGGEIEYFLTKDNYKNYKKLVGLVALLHDSGRPSDGIDQWDDSNEINVLTNMKYFLETAGLSPAGVEKLIQEIHVGINTKDNLEIQHKNFPNGFLFGCPIGAGDSLHSGHAFHGGEWDGRKYNPNYVRLYKQYPEFQEKFEEIADNVKQFLIPPTVENGGKLAAVNNYLCAVEDSLSGEGASIIKADFDQIIQSEFMNAQAEKSPLIAKHFNKESVYNQIEAPLDVIQDVYEKQQTQFNLLLNEILLKSDKLKQRSANKDYQGDSWNAGETCKNLYTNLWVSGKKYFESAKTPADYEEFKKDCDQQLTTAKKTLQHHRGWGDILAKIAASILTIGILPVGMAFRSKAKTGNWGFRMFETDSANKVDAVDSYVQQIKPK